MISLKKLLLLSLAIPGAGGLAQAQFGGDLEPISIDVPSDIYPGQVGEVSSTVKYTGFAGGIAHVKFYLSEDSTITTADTLLATSGSVLIPNGETHTFSMQVMFPAGTPLGTAYVGAWVRSNSFPEETNPNNNIVVTETLGHGQPDLRVDAVAATAVEAGKWGRGEVVNVTADIHNDGGDNAHDLSISVLLGSTLLDSWNGGFLSSGDMLSIDRDVTIPMDAHQGDCSISVVVSSNQPRPDLDQGNNQQLITGTCFLRGSFVSFGEGCEGSNGRVPTLSATDSNVDPIIGSTSTYELTNGPSNYFSVILLGLSEEHFGQLSLPLSFDGFGGPGCSLLTSADASGNMGTDVTGFGSVQIPYPNHPIFIGRELYLQVMCPDPGANAMGWTFSNGLKTTLGSPR